MLAEVDGALRRLTLPVAFSFVPTGSEPVIPSSLVPAPSDESHVSVRQPDSEKTETPSASAPRETKRYVNSAMEAPCENRRTGEHAPCHMLARLKAAFLFDGLCALVGWVPLRPWITRPSGKGSAV